MFNPIAAYRRRRTAIEVQEFYKTEQQKLDTMRVIYARNGAQQLSFDRMQTSLDEERDYALAIALTA